MGANEQPPVLGGFPPTFVFLARMPPNAGEPRKTRHLCNFRGDLPNFPWAPLFLPTVGRSVLDRAACPTDKAIVPATAALRRAAGNRTRAEKTQTAPFDATGDPRNAKRFTRELETSAGPPRILAGVCSDLNGGSSRQHAPAVSGCRLAFPGAESALLPPRPTARLLGMLPAAMPDTVRGTGMMPANPWRRGSPHCPIDQFPVHAKHPHLPRHRQCLQQVRQGSGGRGTSLRRRSRDTPAAPAWAITVARRSEAGASWEAAVEPILKGGHKARMAFGTASGCLTANSE